MSIQDRNKLNLQAYDLIARIYAGDKPAEDDPVMRKQCRELFTSALKGFYDLLREGGVLFLSLIRSSKLNEYIIEDWGGKPGKFCSI